MRLWPLQKMPLFVRGSCPLPQKGAPFKGSIRLPAGYEGETIIVEEYK